MKRIVRFLTTLLMVALIGTRLSNQATRAGDPILYAAPSAMGSGDCSAWENACTLQTALTNALSGDQIWVKAGVHKPGANQSDTFSLKNGVEVYGGFAGTETELDQRNWTANKTILSGDIDNNDITDPNGVVIDTPYIIGQNAFHVVTAISTSSNTVLDGFIITAGRANGTPPHNLGGGMYNVDSLPTLRNLIFSGNEATKYGGGMYNYQSSPTLTNSTFINNSAEYGGGIFTQNSNPTLTNVSFLSNYARYGGGMYNWDYSDPTLTNVIFSGNQAEKLGGGMANQDYSEPLLMNVTFSKNSSENGGGMDSHDNSNPMLTNVIMWGNTATVSGPGYYSYNDGTATFSYSLLQESSCPSGATCGSGMLYNKNPLFVDDNGADNFPGTTDDNLRLQFGSPAIDSGTNIDCPFEDMDGIPRPLDGNGDSTDTCDMGAYEQRIFNLFLPLILKNAP